jgi:parvulin-like peptidyl-prolyl isomerase
LQTLGRRSSIFLVLVVSLVLPGAARAFLWGDAQELVSVNDARLTTEDYRDWWREWQEKDMSVPETPDEFVDWMLLYQEAQAMQLDQNPEFLKKVGIFLKVRALMQLKQDEVGAKTTMPDDKTLWEAYRKGYTPIYNLHMVAVDAEEQAAEIRRLLDAGKSLTDAAKETGLSGADEELAQSGAMRASKIPETLREALVDVPAKSIVGPVPFGHSWYFLEVLERSDGSKEDFAKVKNDLIRQDLKVQENELTRRLTEALAKKYQVTVDEELLGRITAEGFPKEDREKAVLRVGNTVVSVDALYQATLKELEMRGGAHRKSLDFEATKQRVVADAVAQTVTGLEALDRHYENQPPLKAAYDFYRQHRMIKELEKTVIEPGIKVDEKDAQAYYAAHPELFSRGGLAELSVVQTNEAKLAEQVEEKLKAGGDFFKVMQPLSPAGVEVRRTPLDHLHPVIRQAVATMAPGQVSGALKDGENIYFVKLIRTDETESIPFEKVAEDIRTRLREERFAAAKSELVKTLRDRSAIKVNQRAWDSLRKSLIKEGEGKNEK